MEEPILKAEKISKSYGSRRILKNISLDIMPGEIIGIIGASGSGKTTFLNILIGFIKPEEGHVNFKQPKIVAHENNAVYKSVYKNQKIVKNMYGFASQVPSFYEKLTVRENLEYFGELYNLSQETLQANVSTLLKLMDLENSANILGKNLSGGMERRLDIACSLIHNPAILIMDEPTADLDPILRNNIWKLIEKINSKGTTIILASHHLNELETLCSRIAIIKGGEIVGIGSAEQLKSKFSHNKEIRIQSYPGNYTALGNYLLKKFKTKINSFENQGNELLIICNNPETILNELILSLEKKKEKILELKIVKPSLDQLFISIQSEKDIKK